MQYELIKLAFQGTALRLTAVGDTKQKIMGWAGALAGIFQTFANDFNAVPLNMYRNFRSKPRLLRVQNEFIRTLDPSSVMPDEQLVGNEGEVYAWRFKDSQAEAIYLADLINSWINTDQLQPAEIAVLISKQLDLYANHLMTELEALGIPYRNEYQLQDITVEPAARLIVDYLSCLYGAREPKAWIRLTKQLTPFADEEIQFGIRKDLDQLIKKQREDISNARKTHSTPSNYWRFVEAFLSFISSETLTALSPDYESSQRLEDVILETRHRIEELLKIESDLPRALEQFASDRVVRIMTIHKCKGLEFDSVIIMAVENKIFFGDPDENLCAFFVGVSRAKRRLVLTYAEQRESPPNASRWSVDWTAKSEYFNYVIPFIRT